MRPPAASSPDPASRFRPKRRFPLSAPFSRLAIAFAALLAFAAPAAAQDLAFATPGPVESDTGHVLVEWAAPGPATLVIAHDPSFGDAETLYEGANKAFFLSGLEGGDYYLMLRDAEGRQSEALQLSVVHQSLTRAIWLTIIGAIITLGIIATILKGAKDD